MIPSAIYQELSVQNFTQIRSDLTFLFYDVFRVTFFRTQCIIRRAWPPLAIDDIINVFRVRTFFKSLLAILILWNLYVCMSVCLSVCLSERVAAFIWNCRTVCTTRLRVFLQLCSITGDLWRCMHTRFLFSVVFQVFFMCVARLYIARSGSRIFKPNRVFVVA